MDSNDNNEPMASGKQIYDEYSIASEHCIYLQMNSFSCKSIQSACVCWANKKLAIFLTSLDNGKHNLSIADENMHNSICVDNTLVQVVVWHQEDWQQIIVETILINADGKKELELKPPHHGEYNVVVRFPEKRISSTEECFCPPIDSVENDAISIIVGMPNDTDQQNDDGVEEDHHENDHNQPQQHFVVSAHTLMVQSPVFHRLISEMRERSDRLIRIPDVDPKEFREFLAAISPNQLTPPNPTNVCALMMLADRYQVSMLKARCEAHLMNCVEIPQIERLRIADQCGLDNLADIIITNIMGESLQVFYSEHHEVIKGFNEKLIRQILQLIMQLTEYEDSEVKSLHYFYKASTEELLKSCNKDTLVKVMANI